MQVKLVTILTWSAAPGHGSRGGSPHTEAPGTAAWARSPGRGQTSPVPRASRPCHETSVSSVMTKTIND